jgi:hypothetical protein
MTKEELVLFAEMFFTKNINIMKAKNADYSGGASDPFANFKGVGILGIDPNEGFLTRMMDKMMRISSFVKKGELQVKDESVADTLSDLANYCMLMAAYIQDCKEESTNPTVELHLSPK